MTGLTATLERAIDLAERARLTSPEVIAQARRRLAETPEDARSSGLLAEWLGVPPARAEALLGLVQDLPRAASSEEAEETVKLLTTGCVGAIAGDILSTLPSDLPSLPGDATRPSDPSPSTGTAPTAPLVSQRAPEVPIGHLGSYDLLAELGRGAMGIVYRARDTRLDRLVALKVLIDVRLDVMSTMRGAAPFASLWRRRSEMRLRQGSAHAAQLKVVVSPPVAGPPVALRIKEPVATAFCVKEVQGSP